jgi:hypothetical protein
MSARRSHIDTSDTLPVLRFEVIEAAQILRMSRAQPHNHIHDGSINSARERTTPIGTVRSLHGREQRIAYPPLTRASTCFLLEQVTPAAALRGLSVHRMKRPLHAQDEGWPPAAR